MERDVVCGMRVDPQGAGHERARREDLLLLRQRGASESDLDPGRCWSGLGTRDSGFRKALQSRSRSNPAGSTRWTAPHAGIVTRHRFVPNRGMA